MLTMLKNVIAQFAPESDQVVTVSYDRAVAALLIEVMLADDKVEEKELQQVLGFIKQETQLDDVEQMYQEMKVSVEQANDMFQFTKAINEHASNETKESLMKALWRVAFADGVLDEHEDFRIRRISELLYVPHSVFIQTKLAVKSELH